MNKSDEFNRLVDCYLAEFNACRAEMRQYLGAIQKIGGGAAALFCGIIAADQFWSKFPEAIFALLPTIIFAAVMVIVMNLGTHQVLVLRCMQIEREVADLFGGKKPLWSQTFAADKIQGITSPVTLAIISLAVVLFTLFIYGSYRAFVFKKWTIVIHLMELVACVWTMFYEWRLQLRSDNKTP